MARQSLFAVSPFLIRLLQPKGFTRIEMAMWIGEVLVGNPGGTSVFGNLRDFHPRIYALAPVLAWSAVGVTAIGGVVAAYRTSSIAAAFRVGLWSGVISEGITFVTILSILILFHDP